MTFDPPRLEYQVSSLEREVLLGQQTAVHTQTQLTAVQSKYEATPKQEAIDRYIVGGATGKRGCGQTTKIDKNLSTSYNGIAGNLVSGLESVFSWFYFRYALSTSS